MTSMTRDEFAKTPFSREKQAAAVESSARHLQHMQQASVSAENLTGRPEWDIFLSYIQAFVEGAERQQAAFEAKMKDPTVVDHETMMRAKIGAHQCATAARTARAIIGLPKDIIEQGDKAKDLVQRLATTEENEAA